MNMPHSVKQRLMNLAHQRGESFNRLLVRSELQAPPLPETVERLQDFLLPVLDSIRMKHAVGMWLPGGPWHQSA